MGCGCEGRTARHSSAEWGSGARPAVQRFEATRSIELELRSRLGFKPQRLCGSKTAPGHGLLSTWGLRRSQH